MVKPDVDLTEQEQQGLQALAERTGQTQNDLIRKAVGNLLAKQPSGDRIALLRKARGLWKDRTDLDFAVLRSELDRFRRDVCGPE